MTEEYSERTGRVLDASEVKSTVFRCIAAAREFWRIDPTWEINVELKTLKERTMANCWNNPAYRQSYLAFDVAQHPTLEEVWRSAAHEMVHVVLQEFELYLTAPRRKNSNSEKIDDHLWHFALERTTKQLEGVFLREHPYKKE